MARIWTDNAVQIEVRATVDGQLAELVFHVKVPTAIILGTLQQLATLVVNWVLSEMLPLHCQNVFFTDVHLVDVSQPNGVEFTHTVNAAGTDTSVPRSNNAALCVTLRTAQSGRSFRGRKYMFGLTRLNGTAVSWAAGTVVGALGAWESLYDQLQTNNTPLAVRSTHANKAPRARGVLTLVETITADSSVDSQRRRLIGRGV